MTVAAVILAAGTATRAIELGDPGVVRDAAPEDSPLEGPALAPYGQAAEVDQAG